MTWEEVAAVAAISGLLGAVVWRFARLEAAVKHNSSCTRTVAKMMGRLNQRLRAHIKETAGPALSQPVTKGPYDLGD